MPHEYFPPASLCIDCVQMLGLPIYKEMHLPYFCVVDGEILKFG